MAIVTISRGSATGGMFLAEGLAKTLGYQLVRREEILEGTVKFGVAAAKLEKRPKKKDIAFYEGQLKSAQFFIQAILPIAVGKMEAVMATSPAAVQISEDSFGGQ